MIPVLKSSYRVALVDDDDGVRQVLHEFLSQTPGFAVVASCPDGESALRELPACLPDIVLMDICLPGMSGIDCLVKLKTLLPLLRVVMLTGYSDDELILRSFAAGAEGYLLKPSSRDELLAALRETLSGGGAGGFLGPTRSGRRRAEPGAGGGSVVSAACAAIEGHGATQPMD
jgi:DNA-binding NarL/FixJ family response regulator